MSDTLILQQIVNFNQESPAQLFRLIDRSDIMVPASYNHGKIKVAANSSSFIEIAADINFFLAIAVPGTGCNGLVFRVDNGSVISDTTPLTMFAIKSPVIDNVFDISVKNVSSSGNCMLYFVSAKLAS